MRKLLLIAGLPVIAILLLLPHCTINSTTTHNHYYTDGSDTLVVSEQRDTEREEDPETGQRPDPDGEPESNPRPDPGGHGLSDTTWVERLIPGTARVEITCNAEENLVTYRMFDNILSGSGFRFEMNFEKRDYIDGGRDIYYLKYSFNSMNPWDGTETSSSARVESLSSAESAQVTAGRPFLTIDIDGVEFAYDISEIAIRDVEQLTIGSNNVTLWFIASESMFNTIAEGSDGFVTLRDGDKTNNYSITEENFINFSTFQGRT